jgi:glycosyltransferase involved in cell wall biosynthesis
VPFGYTVHDLNFACPTITFLDAAGFFCGAQTDPAVCSRCLAAQPPFVDVDIVDWRARHHALLARASFRIAPSHWVAAMLHLYFPDCAATVIAHGAPEVESAPLALPPLAVPDDGIPTVAFLGAIGPDKGARRIERLVALARERNAPIRFVLIGYMDVEHGPMQSADARFTVHGRYAAPALPGLLDHYRVALVLFPSAGPETFSYTLTEAWSAGRPAVVPPIGALAERVRASGAGVVLTDDQWTDEVRMLDRVLALLDPARSEELAAMGAVARALPHATIDAMTQQTFVHYAVALKSVRRDPRTFAMFEPGRLRAALRYREWNVPRRANEAAMAARAGWVQRLAKAALHRRNTLAGRVLVRITPAPLRAALRSRLKP